MTKLSSAAKISLIESRIADIKGRGFDALDRLIGPHKALLSEAEKNASTLEDTLATYSKTAIAVVDKTKHDSTQLELFGINQNSVQSFVLDSVMYTLTAHAKNLIGGAIVVALYQIITDPLGTLSSLKSIFWSAEEGAKATIVMAGNAVEGAIHKGEELASSGYVATKKVVMSAEDELAQMEKAVYAGAAKYYRPVEKEYNKAYAYYHQKPQYHQPAPPPSYYQKYMQDPALVNHDAYAGATGYDHYSQYGG